MLVKGAVHIASREIEYKLTSSSPAVNLSVPTSIAGTPVGAEVLG
jgi:hypothetical protein